MKTENKNQTRSCQLRTHYSVQELGGCFEVTTWNVFTENCNGPAEIVDTATSYIKVCEETVIKAKSMSVCPNKKPWVTKDLKVHLHQKKIAFLMGKKQHNRQKEKGFRKNARVARLKYKIKLRKN